MTDRTMLQFFKYNLILEALLAESTERESQLRQQLSAVDDREFEWELEKEQLESQLDELSRQLRAQQAQADLLREEARLSGERKRSLDAVRGMDEYPDTPEKIAAYFECHFADRLAFTERGRASLADCKTDPAFYGMPCIKWPPPCMNCTPMPPSPWWTGRSTSGRPSGWPGAKAP